MKKMETSDKKRNCYLNESKIPKIFSFPKVKGMTMFSFSKDQDMVSGMRIGR